MTLPRSFETEGPAITRWLHRLKAWLLGSAPPRLQESADVRTQPLELSSSPSFRTTAEAVTQDDDLSGQMPGRAVDRFARRSTTQRIIEAFDSAHPIRQRQDLHGRDDKLDTLFEAVLFSRQHAIIHGARGSGKTSLAQVFGDYADQQGAVVIYSACEAATSFSELIRSYLAFIPDSAVPFAEKVLFARERDALPADFGPREVVDLMARLAPDSQTILIFDEFDRIENEVVNSQVATLLKLLSDARVPVQVLVVGIARTLDELIRCHPSLRRHLVPIPIGRISRADTFGLIERGAARAAIHFDEDSKAEVAAISCGSPYHVQLFCYVAAIEAVRAGRSEIDLAATRAGMDRAFGVWALLNPEDAEIFEAMLADPSCPQATIERAAHDAAIHDSFICDDAVATLFGAAVRPDGKALARWHFRDGAAPQFLLTKIAAKSRAGIAGSPDTSGLVIPADAIAGPSTVQPE